MEQRISSLRSYSEETDFDDKEDIVPDLVVYLRTLFVHLNAYTDSILLSTEDHPTNITTVTEYYVNLEKLQMMWTNFQRMYERDYLKLGYLQDDRYKGVPHPEVTFEAVYLEDSDQP